MGARWMIKGEAKWKQKDLSIRFIEGVRSGEFTGCLDFWRKVLKPGGCPPQRYRSIRDKGNWETEARLIIGQKALIKAQDGAANQFAALEGVYERATTLASALQDDIVRVRAKPDLSAGDLDKLMNAAHKSQQIAALALERPTSRDEKGGVAVNISFTDEPPPYGRAVIGTDKPVIIALDETRNATPSETPDSQRGEEDTENRPVLQVATLQGNDESVSGGGDIHSPVSESGQDGSVEEVATAIAGTAEEADSGKDE